MRFVLAIWFLWAILAYGSWQMVAALLVIFTVMSASTLLQRRKPRGGAWVVTRPTTQPERQTRRGGRPGAPGALH